MGVAPEGHYTFVGGGFQRSHGFELFPSLISMNTRLGRSRMRSASHSPHCQIRVWGLPGVSGGPLLSGPRPATATPKHEVRESKKNMNKHGILVCNKILLCITTALCKQERARGVGRPNKIFQNYNY